MRVLMNNKCQVFTPENYVDILLDSINYKQNLYGKKILENSCGDGNILIAVVKRYISDCKSYGMDSNEISIGLEKDIYGVEIDLGHYNTCLKKLNELLKDENVKSVKWKLYRRDYLKIDFGVKFDFIVGNPPYITYKELDNNTQKFVRQKFVTCENGKFDYCYAFIEKSISEMSDTGDMSYHIPSSIFKTVFGKKLREMLIIPIIEIVDYKSEKVFKNALVSSAMIVCKNNNNQDNIRYIDRSNGSSTLIDKKKLQNKYKWIFANDEIRGNYRFGDYFTVKHSVATLLNEAYVINEWEEGNDSVLVDGFALEKDIVVNGFAPKTIRQIKGNKIIFPYYYVNNQLCRYTEDEFESKFPNTVNYLLQYYDKLNERKKDSKARWYEYGRSQALSHLCRKKIIMSTVISDEVKLMILDKKSIPYSGVFIYSNGDKSLEEAVKILSSDRFYSYTQKVGIMINGGCVRLTSRDILDFLYEEVD